MDSHRVHPMRASRDDFIQCAHLAEQFDRGGIDVFRACLVAGKAGFVEQEHIAAGLGEPRGQRAPGRTPADDDDFGVAFRHR
jgi:hypothetical protein